jgi:HAD superfamily phosphatase (TIGR01681 family)
VIDPASPGCAVAVKCVVWDLDDTLWTGVLLEGDDTNVSNGTRRTIEMLDDYGVIQSIVSRNDEQEALERLEELGLRECFVYPRIGWGVKSSAVHDVGRKLNIALENLVFVDDAAYERAEVRFVYPEVRCVAPTELSDLLQRPGVLPNVVTEEEFDGPKVAFLRGLRMRLAIAYAGEDDLTRASELTVRTHQLNTTGRTYSEQQLRELVHSLSHDVLVCSLDDRYGSYGRIGLAVIEKREAVWTIKLLLMSCRVMSRNVGTTFLAFVLRAAHKANVAVEAEFAPTDRNRIMRITYRLQGFAPVRSCEGFDVLSYERAEPPGYPDYVEVLGPGG